MYSVLTVCCSVLIIVQGDILTSYWSRVESHDVNGVSMDVLHCNKLRVVLCIHRCATARGCYMVCVHKASIKTFSDYDAISGKSLVFDKAGRCVGHYFISNAFGKIHASLGSHNNVFLPKVTKQGVPRTTSMKDFGRYTKVSVSLRQSKAIRTKNTGDCRCSPSLSIYNITKTNYKESLFAIEYYMTFTHEQRVKRMYIYVTKENRFLPLDIKFREVGILETLLDIPRCRVYMYFGSEIKWRCQEEHQYELHTVDFKPGINNRIFFDAEKSLAVVESLVQVHSRLATLDLEKGGYKWITRKASQDIVHISLDKRNGVVYFTKDYGRGLRLYKASYVNPTPNTKRMQMKIPNVSYFVVSSFMNRYVWCQPTETSFSTSVMSAHPSSETRHKIGYNNIYYCEELILCGGEIVIGVGHRKLVFFDKNQIRKRAAKLRNAKTPHFKFMCL